MAMWGSALFILGITEILYSFILYGSIFHEYAVAMLFAFGGQFWIYALYDYTKEKLDWKMLRKNEGEALSLKPDLPKLIRATHWLLIIFLVFSTLGALPFLCRLLIFYNHGGERLLAHLAAHDIRLWEQGGSMDNRVSDLGYNYFNTGYCRSPEGNWGCFQLNWNTLDVKKYRLSLQTTKDNHEVRFLQPDFIAVSSRNKITDSNTLIYYLFVENGVLTWKSDKGGDVAPLHVQGFLASLPSEEGETPYSQRRDYYKSMAANDIVYFFNFGNNAKGHGGPYYAFFLIGIMPKTVVQWLWLHLFALLPGKALKYALPIWLAANILLLVVIAKSLAHRIKIMKKDADGPVKA
ncbi:hypothetical protein ACOBQJ_01970 [Pelotomaculum propionicicum]